MTADQAARLSAVRVEIRASWFAFDTNDYNNPASGYEDAEEVGYFQLFIGDSAQTSTRRWLYAGAGDPSGTMAHHYMARKRHSLAKVTMLGPGRHHIALKFYMNSQTAGAETFNRTWIRAGNLTARAVYR